jgi:hypothetical protein
MIVPLSTSNSSERVPAGRWTLIWAMGIVFAIFGMTSIENFWREQGFRPSATDDLDWWAVQRGRVYHHNGVVLLGTSRMQYGFATDVFRKAEADRPIIQLAIAGGGSPLAVLEDLASDSLFSGTVVCEVPNWWLRDGAWDDQREYVEHYHRTRRQLSREFDAICRQETQAHLVSLNPRLNLERYWLALLAGNPVPQPATIQMFADRSGAIDFTRMDIDAYRRRRLAESDQQRRRSSQVSVSSTSTDDQFNRINGLVQSIQKRGGNVCFVRFPVAPEREAFDEAEWPRRITWDNFAETTSAAMIHYKDVASLQGYRCPDLSHLDRTERGAFTTALINILEKSDAFQIHRDSGH